LWTKKKIRSKRMIAEIKNKGKNETISSEDELTGNFFGSLRYLPFSKGLKYILKSAIYPKSLEKMLDRIDAEEWDEKITFWRSIGGCEPDVLLTFANAVILIEVKYHSDLSSPDQLVKYGKLLDDYAGEKEKILILLAREGDARRIYDSSITSKEQSQLGNVCFGYITWQSAYDALESLIADGNLNMFEKVIICDLVDLLCQKGFERFCSFDTNRLVVDNDMKWTFDYSTACTGDFSFVTEKSAERGLYYEFR
jgi:hypothetical protein